MVSKQDVPPALAERTARERHPGAKGGRAARARVDAPKRQGDPVRDVEDAGAQAFTAAETTEAPSPGAPPAHNPAIGDQLHKLAELHDRGALTEEEFAQAKQVLLTAPAAPAPSWGPPAAPASTAGFAVGGFYYESGPDMDGDGDVDGGLFASIEGFFG